MAYPCASCRAPENRSEPASRNLPDILLSTLLICVPGAIVARWMAIFLPFLLRSLHVPQLHLQLAFALARSALRIFTSSLLVSNRTS
jgi:hypothetical protein